MCWGPTFLVPFSTVHPSGKSILTALTNGYCQSREAGVI